MNRHGRWMKYAALLSAIALFTHAATRDDAAPAWQRALPEAISGLCAMERAQLFAVAFKREELPMPGTPGLAVFDTHGEEQGRFLSPDGQTMMVLAPRRGWPLVFGSFSSREGDPHGDGRTLRFDDLPLEAPEAVVPNLFPRAIAGDGSFLLTDIESNRRGLSAWTPRGRHLWSALEQVYNLGTIVGPDSRFILAHTGGQLWMLSCDGMVIWSRQVPGWVSNAAVATGGSVAAIFIRHPDESNLVAFDGAGSQLFQSTASALNLEELWAVDWSPEGGVVVAGGHRAEVGVLGLSRSGTIRWGVSVRADFPAEVHMLLSAVEERVLILHNEPEAKRAVLSLVSPRAGIVWRGISPEPLPGHIRPAAATDLSTVVVPGTKTIYGFHPGK